MQYTARLPGIAARVLHRTGGGLYARYPWSSLRERRRATPRWATSAHQLLRDAHAPDVVAAVPLSRPQLARSPACRGLGLPKELSGARNDPSPAAAPVR
jgi:hypothetical protein